MATPIPAASSGTFSTSGPTCDADVIIVGAGPTGLTLAAELAIAGVNVRVLERRTDQALDGSRAGGLHAHTLELLEQRGALEPFLAAGTAAQIVGFAWLPLDIRDFPTRHPYGLALPQQDIEHLLLAWVSRLGVPIRRDCHVARIVQNDAQVEVHLHGAEVMRARWVVGCDGAHSIVRRHAGIAFEGTDASISHLLAELRLSETPPWGLRRDAQGIHAIAPLADSSSSSGGGPRARIMLTEANVDRSQAPTLSDIRERLRAVYGQDFGAHDATWLSWFTDAARQALQYRVGRVLIAGDAAHTHYPTGGQGLNLGMQDAFNLGWKLAQVVRGISDPSLLDTYQRERHPIAARVLQNTRAQSALLRTDAQTEALRESVASWLSMHEPRVAVAAMLSGLDVHYASENEHSNDHALCGRRVPDVELLTANGPTRFSTLLRDARPLLVDLGVRDGIDIGPCLHRVRMINAECSERWALPVIGEVAPPAGLLVRPDGYVSWVSNGTTDGLAESLMQWHGCTSPTHNLPL